MWAISGRITLQTQDPWASPNQGSSPKPAHPQEGARLKEPNNEPAQMQNQTQGPGTTQAPQAALPKNQAVQNSR